MHRDTPVNETDILAGQRGKQKIKTNVMNGSECKMATLSDGGKEVRRLGLVWVLEPLLKGSGNPHLQQVGAAATAWGRVPEAEGGRAAGACEGDAAGVRPRG